MVNISSRGVRNYLKVAVSWIAQGVDDKKRLEIERKCWARKFRKMHKRRLEDYLVKLAFQRHQFIDF